MRLDVIRRVATERDFDVVRTISYRSELFGEPFSRALQDVMRGPSEWPVGERELFAAFVSAQNQCPFWTASHGAVASYALGTELVQAILSDYRTAPIDDELRRTLAFLAKVTLRPDEVGADDVPEGVAREKLTDALYVCAYFNLIDRLADSLGFELPPDEIHHSYAEQFLLEGYGNEVWAANAVH